MQIIQSPLGNNIHPLGIISSLSNSHKMGFTKESHFLHSQNNYISNIQNNPQLVTSSKFLLSREHEPFIQPLIGWDTWDDQDINSEFPPLESDYFDSITPPENNTINSSESVQSSIPAIMPTPIDQNTSNEASSEINLKGKSKSKKPNKSQQPAANESKSKKPNKSQQPAAKKSTTKSNPKKTVKSSATKNIEQFVDESNISINLDKDSLLASNEPLSLENNTEIPTFQLNTASDSTTIESFSINNITPIITASTSSNVDDKSTVFKNIDNDELQLNSELPSNNDELQLNSELPSSLPSADSFVTKSIFPSKEKIELGKDTNKLAEDLPIELPATNNVEEILTPHSNFPKNEQQVITEASESVNSSDIPVSLTPSKENIKKYQTPSTLENKITGVETNSIQAKDISSTLDSPSLLENLPYTNSSFQEITAIESDLISESIANDFVTTDKAMADNSLENVALSSAFTSLDIDDTLHSSANDADTIDTHINLPDSESSIAKKSITVQQEIDSSVTSESPANTPVQLTPNSVDIEDTLSLFTNSDNNEQLVASELQSAMAVNVSDVSANIISLEHDSNVENTTSESTGSQPILAPSEIGETPTITATSPEITETPTIIATSPEISETGISNDKSLGIYAPLPATSPEISKTQTVTGTSPEISETQTIPATSPEISETGISNENPLGIYAPLPATSPEIVEAPTITTTLPEISETQIIPGTSPAISETGISNDKPLGIYAPLPATSPEIAEAPKIITTSSEIIETQTIIATSPEISETQIIPGTSPEISETGISNDKPLSVYAPLPGTSPEISETQTIPGTSPEISETGISNDKSLGIYAPLPAISPEIGEAPVVSAISPEIVEAPTITTASPEINETASIFRKIIDNEQTGESEFRTAVTNPEILTFVDTSENPTSLQNEVSTPPEVEQNTTVENLPAPKGYATGGQVTDSHADNRQQIAPSDTVPAMLTPGEFVINTRDAQKNLPLLHHINTGGTPHDIILPSLQTPNSTEPEEKTSPETPTKVDSFPDTSLQQRLRLKSILFQTLHYS